MYQVSVEQTFSAAHQLVGYEGACENLHGHNWRVQVHLESEVLDSLGMVYDFKKLKRLLQDVIQTLDHRLLNEVPPFDSNNPTAENLARYVYDNVKARLPGQLRIVSAQVSESPNCTATYSEG